MPEEPPTTIDASIQLSVDDKTRHYIYFGSQPGAGSIHKDHMGGARIQTTVKVRDGRDNPDLTLDSASFELIECPTSLSKADFYRIQEGSSELQDKYHDEVSAFVKEKIGCDKVVCFHSQVRNSSKAGKDGVQPYATGGPHTDSSPVSGDELALHTLAGDETKYKRYLYLNLWRNISDDPIEDNHLAMLDERTTAKPDDYIPQDLFGPGYTVVQYGLNARHAANHKWYYYPKMRKDEAILFKQTDSDWTKPGRICFHMSVADPKAPANAKTRESIELRMMCFWKEAEVDSLPTEKNMNRELIRDPLEIANSSSTLDNASLFSLIVALIRKVPVLGRLLAGSASAAKSTYKGDPALYEDQFTTVVNSYPSWPAFAVKWVEGEMRKAGSSEKGIAFITKALVDDQMGYQKTKAFKSDEKKEIVDYLLANEKYMATAMKHWGELATKK